MRVVLVVGLVFVVLDLDEIGVGGSGVEGEGDQRVDGRGFGEELEGPGLDGCVGSALAFCMYVALHTTQGKEGARWADSVWRVQQQPHLLVLKLDQIPVVHHHLVPLAHALLEQLRQRKPLPRHLVPVVRVHELVVVHAVRRVPLHPLHRRLAAVERDDVVEQRLSGLV